MHTRSPYYRSPSPDYFEGTYTENFGPRIDTKEAFEPLSALDTTSRLRVLSVGTFDDMGDDPRLIVKDRLSRSLDGLGVFSCLTGSLDFVLG